MKKTIIILFAFALTPNLWAESAPLIKTIQVTGTGEIKAAPNEVSFNLSIETSDVDLDKAKAEHDKKSNDVIKSLKNFKIEDKHIQTTWIDIQPQYRYVNNRQLFDKYQMTHSIHVTLTDISLFGKVLAACINSGLSRFNGISYGHSNEEGLQDQALKKAVENAHRKAGLIAKETQQKIVGVYSVTEGYNAPVQPVYRQSMMMAKTMMAEDAMQTSVELGEISFSQTVTVIFETE